jgi:uncharacterized protein (TIGR02271 family)
MRYPRQRLIHQDAKRADTVEVPLSEEEVKVGKRTVGAGEVKLHQTVTIEQVNVPVELKQEDIVVERVAALEVESSGTEPFREQRIKVTLNREEPVVEKETRVTCGVRVRKTKASNRRQFERTLSMKAVKLADRQRPRENRAEEKLKSAYQRIQERVSNLKRAKQH